MIDKPNIVAVDGQEGLKAVQKKSAFLTKDKLNSIHEGFQVSELDLNVMFDEIVAEEKVGLSGREIIHIRDRSVDHASTQETGGRSLQNTIRT